MANLLSWLGKQLHGVEAQLNPWDNGQNYNTVVNNAPVQQPQQQAPRPQQPALPRMAGPQGQGAPKILSPQAQQSWMQANQMKTQAPRIMPMDYGKAAGQVLNGTGAVVNNVGNFMLNGTAKLANQGAGIVENLGGNIAGDTQKLFGDQAGGQNTINAVKQRVDSRLLQKGAGLFGTGGIYNSSDALHNAKPQDVAIRAGGTAVQSLAERLPIKPAVGIIKGAAPVVNKMVGGALLGVGQGAAYSAGSQLGNTGKIDPRQLATDTAISGVIGGALPAAVVGAQKLAPVVKKGAVNAADAVSAKLHEPVAQAAEKASGLPRVNVLNDNEAHTLGDYADMAMGRWNAPNSTRNQVVMQARNAAKTAGFDITNMSPAEADSTIASYLQARDTYNGAYGAAKQQMMQGGYARVPGKEKPISSEQPFYRGATSSEWNDLQNGGVSANKKNGRAFIGTRDDAEMAVGAHQRNGKSGNVIIEYKPTAKHKIVSGGSVGQNVGGNLDGEYQAQGLGLSDIARVTDEKGKVIYEDTSNSSNKAGRQLGSTNSQPIGSALQGQGLPPADTQIQGGKATQSPLSPDTGTSTSPLNHQANLSEQATQKTVQQLRQGEVKLGNSPSALRTRGFIDTIQNDVNTPQVIKDNISSLYQTRNTKELQLKAATLVRENPDLAHQVAMSNTGDVSQMVGSELIKHHNTQGAVEHSISLAQEIAKRATEHGQASQALSAYAKLTPEGILRFTQKEISRFNEANKLSEANQIKLTPEKAQSLVDQSTALQTMTEGRGKDIATQKMLNDVKSILPAGWVKQVSTLQTVGQLLNPKTAIRNVVGNAIFGTMDNVAQVGAAGLDRATSKVLGTERTTTLPNMKVQGAGILKGAKQATEEVLHGVNLGPETQFELSQVPVFKSKFMQGVEKTLGVTLQAPDRAAYQATFDDTIHGLMKANKVDKPTQAMIEQANANGLYRTFQDNSKTAQLFSGLKTALNNVGVEKNGSRFGLGDLILKYPKTPGNIIARGLDYSPVGIMKGLYQIVKPAISKQPFDQHTFVNSVSRGTIGTVGLVGAGAVLGSLGIITEKPSQDADTRNLQKASGQGGYQINTSALRRFFLSGFNKDSTKLQKGDTLVSYDWAQPLSIPLSAGAAIGKGQSALDGATSSVANLASGLNTLVEQPLISGVNTFANNIKNKGVIGALGETVKSAPASFVPTISNQARQLTDNTTRSTYDPNAFKMSLNQVTNKIPFLEKGLQPQVDTLGNQKENYQNGSNNIFNVMFNPSFVSQYNPNAAAKLPLDMLANSGETQQMPHTTQTSQKVNGGNVKLTPQQNHDFQQYVGTHTSDYYNQLMKDPTFMAKTDADKAKIMGNGLTDISKAGKIAILGDTSKATAAQVAIANGQNVYKNNTGATTLAQNLDKASTDTLTKYNAMSATDKTKAFSTDSAAEFQYNQAKYNNDKANGTITPIQDIARKTSLAKDQIGSNYSQDVRSLYGMSKAQIASYVSQASNGQDLVNQLSSYDQALKSAGLNKSLKFASGVTSTARRASGGRKVAKGKGSTAMKSAVSYTNKMKMPKIGKMPSFNKSGIVASASFKKSQNKTYKVAKTNIPKIPNVKLRKVA